ncbi:MAG: efflux transporter periplasmic adaptor subunit [Flavobacteriales bacterium]|nr:MAG: efflux transporter periplasmic adaptor subunit [Flavobacteriales bacterium]
MKKLVLIAASFLLIACGEKSTEDLIKDKNITELKNRKATIQSELEKIDAALLNGNKTPETEALVSVITLKDTVFNHYLEIQGNVNTKDNILVQPEFSGTLTILNVKAGQLVSKGQILGKVDDAGMSQQLASIENQYALAKTTFERQKNLWDKKIGSEIQFLQAQAQMISAQKSVAQMRAQVAKTVIRAPFSGTIDEVFVERGQVVSSNPQGLMRIVNLSNMYVSTTVPETYIGKLKVGTAVDVFLTSLGKTYKGKVRQVASFINPSNRSFGIEVSVPNPDNLLRPNQVAQLKIIDYAISNAIVVPTNVVQEDGENNKFVFIATNINGKKGVAKKVIVKIGQSSENGTEILSGLKTSDVIVAEGLNVIAEGTKLNF